ncbi:family 43 glycosylhydrolase [Lutibacter citreus]|uniref:family 43 glycosylhydrolase n=1 Tax=Lutibacter citreus TaxID=2138210 RepID=UPI000DBE158C|nr:family 43 glycosylhydrolase [Lutibacter citreus]
MKSVKLLLLLCFVFIKTNAQFQKVDTNKFQNPIFIGDNPDPSILVEEDDYYITFSSFDYYPGLPIWHSKDLINWNPVSHAITKNVGSVWAPDLIKYNDKYYVYFPANKTNWVVWANSIEGPWSEPIDLKVRHIDPGHIVDDEGKRYIHLSQGHYVQLADDGLSIVGEVKKSYEGWKFPKEWSVETFGLEGPKLMKRGDYYYMTVAQGGTAGPATSHMVVSARSKTPFGPWENSPYNPIVRTENKSEKWWSKGHGTPFKDTNNKWWLVFHGYENGFYQMGRQVLLQPIEWTKDGWFKTPEGIRTEMPILRPKAKSKAIKYDLSDNFSSNKLKFQWQFYKNNNPERYSLVDNKLVLKGMGETTGEAFPLLCMPLHHSYSAQVDVETEEGTIGGLTLFYNEKGFVSSGADQSKIYYSNKGWQRPVDSFKKADKISIKLINKEGTVDFYYSLNGKDWIKTDHSALVSSFNHNAFGGFLSLKLGLYATGNGRVKFSNFKYKKLE